MDVGLGLELGFSEPMPFEVEYAKEASSMG